MKDNSQLKTLKEGELPFSIEGRVLRELGERLVKTPEVAIVELIKNSYDAEATECWIDFAPPKEICISDNGHGMTLDQFGEGWMRVGTSSKETIRSSFGFGIKFYSMIGPIGFTWGFPISSEDYDIERMFTFSVGNLN